mmetsp:Transcript_68612/g.149939  ORF Transcript_68612/g.149939 Transcript_68612/m.149939 type:complete len:95 (-) Transcript_68612:14-298(-)
MENGEVEGGIVRSALALMLLLLLLLVLLRSAKRGAAEEDEDGVACKAGREKRSVKVLLFSASADVDGDGFWFEFARFSNAATIEGWKTERVTIL